MEKIDFEKKYVISGYGFDEEGPYLKLDDVNEDRRRHKFHFVNEDFTMSRFKGRRCIGRYDLATFKEEICPHNAVLQTRADVCMRCFRSIGFNPAFYNVSEDDLSPQQRDYNRSPHDVYLAHFTSGRMKVGIANAERKRIRWLEQGARSALTLRYCDDAYEARKLEKSVREKFGITEMVRFRDKSTWLNENYDQDNARRELLGLKAEICRVMGFASDTEEVEFFDKIYLGNNVLKGNLTDVSKGVPLVISGRGIGLVGPSLIVEQELRQYVANIKKFVSHIVSLRRDFISHNVKPTQMSLL